MIIKQILIGGDRNYSYLLADEETHAAAVIDPSYHPEKMDQLVNEMRLSLQFVINTHLHPDHTNGNSYFIHKYKLPVLQYGAGLPESNETLDDGCQIQLGKLTLTFIYTPGHTPDSICIYVPGAVFTGDTLFVGKVGGTDFGENARLEYDSLHQKLMTLPDDTVVYPGHNYGIRPTSTIGEEKKSNPFIIQPDFEHFVDLKRNWAEYKRKHGIA
ncbi:MAG: hydroxyacylglutathione hydrolase family protein [Calditrichia bacterium]